MDGRSALLGAADEIADLGFEGSELRRIQEVVQRRAERVLALSAPPARG